jgi:hypothetical protein
LPLRVLQVFRRANPEGYSQHANVNVPTWRENALRGATIGALVFIGVALLFGAAYWL